MHRLSCVAQQYEWGKRGSASAVARFASSGDKSPIDETRPYAEYWFGTHPSGPSRMHVGGKDVLLHDWLLANPGALGIPPYDATTALPYLFKVLSVAKALSIQAHPDRELGARLHAARPDMYRDANHKPELACALTPFLAMCGFRPAPEIARHLATVPELRAAVGDAAAEAFEAAAAAASSASSGADAALKCCLRDVLSSLMHRDAAAVASLTAALAARLAALPEAAGGPAAATHPDAVARVLCGQYPGDIGVLAPYLLNTVELAPGEAVFLAANEPHAYLSGDCVEVMATSDNVVRAGLTPKFKDVDVLVDMLTYRTGAPPVDRGAAVDAHTRRYTAPVPEFELQRTDLTAAAGAYALPPVSAATIWVVVDGEGLATAQAEAAAAGSSGEGAAVLVECGQVWLQEAHTAVTLRTDRSITLFRATAGAR